MGKAENPPTRCNTFCLYFKTNPLEAEPVHIRVNLDLGKDSYG